MSLRHSGPAALHCDAGIFRVHAVLSTVVASGTYSWGGRLTTTDVAALAARGQGGTLTLSVPPEVDAEVHVAVADLDPETGGVILRITGHGRAPYEQDGDITAARGEAGATVYQVAEKAPAASQDTPPTQRDIRGILLDAWTERLRQEQQAGAGPDALKDALDNLWARHYDEKLAEPSPPTGEG